MYCAICLTDVTFEQPPCDDHGADCPELLCTACGAAVLYGPGVTVVASRRSSAA